MIEIHFQDNPSIEFATMVKACEYLQTHAKSLSATTIENIDRQIAIMEDIHALEFMFKYPYFVVQSIKHDE